MRITHQIIDDPKSHKFLVEDNDDIIKGKLQAIEDAMVFKLNEIAESLISIDECPICHSMIFKGFLEILRDRISRNVDLLGEALKDTKTVTFKPRRKRDGKEPHDGN